MKVVIDGDEYTNPEVNKKYGYRIAIPVSYVEAVYEELSKNNIYYEASVLEIFFDILQERITWDQFLVALVKESQNEDNYAIASERICRMYESLIMCSKLLNSANVSNIYLQLKCLMILGLDIESYFFLPTLVRVLHHFIHQEKDDNAVSVARIRFVVDTSFKIFDFGESPFDGNLGRRNSIECTSRGMCKEEFLCQGCIAYNFIKDVYTFYAQDISLFKLLNKDIFTLENPI